MAHLLLVGLAHGLEPSCELLVPIPRHHLVFLPGKCRVSILPGKCGVTGQIK